MSHRIRMGAAGVALAAMSVLVLHGAASSAGDESSAGDDKVAREGVLKIAAALQKGDDAGAKSQAAALAKKLERLEEAMDLFKLRSKKGLGVGSKPGVFNPDGIEMQLIKIENKIPSPGNLAKQAEALEQMSYVVGALAEIARAKPPERDLGKKTKKVWMEYVGEMREGADKLAAAVKVKSADKMKAALTQLNASCTNCHAIFKP